MTKNAGFEIGKKPMGKLRPNQRQISARLCGGDEPMRPLLRDGGLELVDRLKKPVLKMGERARDTDFTFVCAVVVIVNGAANRAAFAVFPVFTGNDFIGLLMGEDAVNIGLL